MEMSTREMGQNWLIQTLNKHGISVVVTEKGHAADLTATDDESGQSVAIKLVTNADHPFSVRRYDEQDMKVVFVFNLKEDFETRAYVHTPAEGSRIGDEMGWFQTRSWQKEGYYRTPTRTERLRATVAPYLVNDDWRQRLFGTDQR